MAQRRQRVEPVDYLTLMLTQKLRNCSELKVAVSLCDTSAQLKKKRVREEKQVGRETVEMVFTW